MRESDLETILDTSITQTLGRTILTNTTVLLSIIALYVVGKGDIKNFALLMIVGVLEGSYSTIFVASPIVYMWTRARDRRRKARELAKYGRGLSSVAPGPAAPAPAEAEMESVEAETMARSPQEAGAAMEAGEETAEEELPEEALGQPAAAVQAPKPAVAPVGPAAVQPAATIPQGTTGAAAGGYVRVQRRHKKRRR